MQVGGNLSSDQEVLGDWTRNPPQRFDAYVLAMFTIKTFKIIINFEIIEILAHFKISKVQFFYIC